jgi:hypothetical protein
MFMLLVPARHTLVAAAKRPPATMSTFDDE